MIGYFVRAGTRHDHDVGFRKRKPVWVTERRYAFLLRGIRFSRNETSPTRWILHLNLLSLLPWVHDSPVPNAVECDVSVYNPSDDRRGIRLMYLGFPLDVHVTPARIIHVDNLLCRTWLWQLWEHDLSKKRDARERSKHSSMLLGQIHNKKRVHAIPMRKSHLLRMPTGASLVVPQPCTHSCRIHIR